MLIYATNSAGTGFVIQPDLSGKRGVTDGESAGALLATGLYKEIAKGGLTDAQINAIPDLPG